MRVFIYILFCLFLASASFAQTKYYIYFKDKGVTKETSLLKTSPGFRAGEKELSSKAVERRKGVMGDQNYVTFEDLPLNIAYLNTLESLGVKFINKLKWFNAVTAYLTGTQVNDLAKLPFVDKIVPVRIIRYQHSENQLFAPVPKQNTGASIQNAMYSLNYGNSLTQNALSDIPTVHDLGIKGTGVYVGILDDGFSYKIYTALKNLKVVKQYDYVHQTALVSNQSGHGSSVFCLIAGYDPGNAIGPAYDAQFFLAETENDASETHIEEDNYAQALQDMEAAGVDMTTSSLGYDIFDPGQGDYTFSDMDGQTTICAKAVNLAFQRGVTLFNAAGNERGNSWNHIITPADAFNIIAVGSVTSKNIVSGFSSPGPSADGRIKPEVAAMGSSDTVPLSDGVNYVYGDGTSYATPIAAGIGAMLKSAYPHLTNVQIRKIFLECGDHPANRDNNTGYGLISAKRVISYPNLKQESTNSFLLNKIFIDAGGVNSSTVKLNYRINGGNFQSVSMSYDGSLKYNYLLPVANPSDLIEFNFTYQNSNSSSVREPSSANDNYKFSFGSNNISHLTDVQNSVNPVRDNFTLSQNYPNPFNPSTTIIYSIPVDPAAAGRHIVSTLKVYDILGREVATLVNGEKAPGIYEVKFNGSGLPSGVYFYRLQTGSFSQTKKFVLMK